jgi:hypothetical protein
VLKKLRSEIIAALGFFGSKNILEPFLLQIIY